MVLSLMALLSGCEFDKYTTLEEAIKKDIPNKVTEVIYREVIDDVVIVMYTAKF
jgi:hypothetical protein